MLTRLNIARALIIFGFLTGLGSLCATVGHIGDPAFMATSDFDVQTHTWYHAFREVFGDIAAMAAIVLIVFAPPAYRTPLTWWVGFVLMLGYYLPFWAGMPFMAALSAPGLNAEINHVAQAVLALSGLFYGRKEFFQTRNQGV